MTWGHLAAALLGALAVGLLWLGLWLRREGPRLLRAHRRRTGTHTRYPVVLCHGFLGFDSLEIGGQRHDYFRGVPERLKTLGSEVHVIRVPAIGTIAARAEALVRAIDALNARRVNLIAHSMGGLDARHALSRLGLAERVASLTTIGTPHRGTPLADLGHSVLGKGLKLSKALDFALGSLARPSGLDLGGLSDLTSLRMAAFNQATPDARGPSYGSIVGAIAPNARWRTHPLLWPTHLYLQKCAGPNDGVVPTSSQRWGEVLGEIPADHWAQIGWAAGWSPKQSAVDFDVLAFYADLLLELRGRGC